MEHARTDSSGDSPRYSKLKIALFIISPALLMICMAVLEAYVLPLIYEQSFIFMNDTKLDMFFSVSWAVFISFKLRHKAIGNWFFSWWPVLAVLSIVAAYALSALAGLPVTREEIFPAILVMFPTMGFLFLLSIGSTIYKSIKWLVARLRG